MFLEIIHWSALVIATVAGYIYFRDLGDVTQIFMNVTRQSIVKTIRNEKLLIGLGVGGITVGIATHFLAQSGHGGALTAISAAVVFMFCFPYIWLRVGLRNQQNTATYYSVEEARRYVRSEDSGVVIEHNGLARAHPNYHIKRPHLAGTPHGLNGKNVIMTYCALSHLGMGYIPEIENEKLDLVVIAQHGNNLIMKDKATGEPIQQVYGSRERDGQQGPQMTPWPTFRMSFAGFAKAYPEGQVFLNKIVPFKKNPILNIFDNFIEGVFLWGVTAQHVEESLLMDTLENEDDRLPRKTLIWGVNIDGEAAAFTEEFVRKNDNLVNATVGGRQLVIAYSTEFESMGVYYNDTSAEVTQVDFWGDSNVGKLKRVETLQAGAYWCVWYNYFPHTKLNELDSLDELSADETPAIAAAS